VPLKCTSNAVLSYGKSSQSQAEYYEDEAAFGYEEYLVDMNLLFDEEGMIHLTQDDIICCVRRWYRWVC
jgi:hypothetical protein